MEEALILPYDTWVGNETHWGNWKTLEGSVFLQVRHAVFMNNGKIMVFARGPEYTKPLWSVIFNGTHWDVPTEISRKLKMASAPSAVVTGNGTIIAFGRGSDTALWYIVGNDTYLGKLD